MEAVKAGATDEPLFELLDRASRDPSPVVREEVAWAVGYVADERRRTELRIRLEQDQDAFVQRAAQESRGVARRSRPEPDSQDPDHLLARRLRTLEARYGRTARVEFEAALRPWLAQAASAAAHEFKPIHIAIHDAIESFGRRKGLEADPGWQTVLGKISQRFQLIDRILEDYRDYVRAAPELAELERAKLLGLLGEACRPDRNDCRLIGLPA